MPLSFMRNSNAAYSGSGEGLSITLKFMVPPSGVNFIAFERILRVPLKTALNRENEMIAPNARKGSESLLTQGEET
jgi:hypothetical protein